MSSTTPPSLEVSVLILTLDEEGTIGEVIKESRGVLDDLGVSHEIVVIDGGSRDSTEGRARAAGARVIRQEHPGYGEAFLTGIRHVRGSFVLTLDADYSHPPEIIKQLWKERGAADVIVASRFVSGGSSGAPLLRRFSSWLLSLVYSRILAIPAHDLSSGFRLYRRPVLRPQYRGRHFDILVEVLIRAVCDGYSIREVPFNYESRMRGISHVRFFSFARAYILQFFRLWRLRNSIEAADYDHRAYDSRVPMQRYWQRKRFKIVGECLGRNPGMVLDVGCGSSRIVQSLPDAVALDITASKLRVLKNSNPRRLQASTFALPLRSDAFDAVIHSQVIEHIPFHESIFSELRRVLKRGGLLILGTPDYGRVWWPIIEFFYDKIIPQGYAQEHITHYSRDDIERLLARFGFDVVTHYYICGGELIVKAVKR